MHRFSRAFQNELHRQRERRESVCASCGGGGGEAHSLSRLFASPRLASFVSPQSTAALTLSLKRRAQLMARGEKSSCRSSRLPFPSWSRDAEFDKREWPCSFVCLTVCCLDARTRTNGGRRTEEGTLAPSVRLHSIMFDIVKSSTISGGGGVGGPGCRCRCTCGAGGPGYAAHIRRGSLRGLQRMGEREK